MILVRLTSTRTGAVRWLGPDGHISVHPERSFPDRASAEVAADEHRAGLERAVGRCAWRAEIGGRFFFFPT